MERSPLPIGTDPEMTRVLNSIFDGAIGNVIVLDSAPTTSGGQLNPNQIGYFSNTLYVNINGTTFSVALTAV